MTKNQKPCQTHSTPKYWKVFVLKVTGVTAKPQKMTLDAETLCQKHPELEALINSLQEDDKLKLTITSTPKEQKPISVSIESLWGETPEEKPVQLSLQLT
ncbi:MAG: hypothetical protein KME30_33445 [Iphinoe sp. HA4291-MV1]|jgi:hypothetical protein|nr:hypothetical protein [Iphinoe sp. HA4291-MV1]